MNSFDQNIIKVKEALSVAYKKTGEVLSVQKQKLALASMCSDLEKLYAELGRLQYKKLNGRDIDDNAINLIISDIRETLKEMKALKEEIDMAEGKRTCPVCGSKAPAKSNFCNACGSSFDDASQEL